MRNWTKYIINYSANQVTKSAQDSSFLEHANAMEYYGENDATDNKYDFFNKYFFNYHTGRLLNYDKFLRKHIKKSYRVLSVASGRSANELKLLEEGYDITCSDLEKLPSYENTKNLFPEYKFFTLNILRQPADHKYDCLISLSLIYLFSNDQLDLFFSNLYKSCEENGCLILDSAGSPDNLLSYFLHDFLVKYETFLVWFLRNLFQNKKYGLNIKDHGYRRNDLEIVEIAKKNGFELIEQENFAFLVEFQRSRLLRDLIKIRFINNIFAVIGKHVPYTRMFFFRKTKS
jgi:hypothetical protein